MPIMTLDQFRSAYQTGGLASVSIKATGAAFLVAGHPRQGEPVILATSRGKTERRFANPAKALALLHQIGARKVEVDTSAWSPDQPPDTARRPDTAERQKRAHEAADYDAWFRAEVQKALREADDPNTVWIDNDEVERQSLEDRARWRAQANWK